MYTYKNIPVTTNNSDVQKHLHVIMGSPKFRRYVDSIDLETIAVQEIRVDAATWFCRPSDIAPEKLGFLYMEVRSVDRRNGKPLPGVVFLRGGAVAIHLEIQEEGTDNIYVVLCKQARVPAGRVFREIPAGMMDASGNIAGVMIKEVKEETGVVIPNIEDLIDLGEPIFPSPGGCDEWIKLFMYRTTKTSAEIEEMKKKILGNENEGESIILEFVPREKYEDCLQEMGDVKAMCAYLRAKLMKL